MRLWAFVLLEVGALAGASGLTLLGARSVRAGLGQAHGAYPLLERGPGASRSDHGAAVSAYSGSALDPRPLEVSTTAAGTFMGMKDELLLDHLRTADIAEAKLNKGGSSISFRLTFTDGSRAAFKPVQTNPQTVPRKEVAAYRLARLLGLNAVPPATMRTLHRDELVGKLPPDLAFLITRIDAETLFDPEGFTRGEVSYWIPVIADSHLDSLESVIAWWRWMTVGEEIPPEKWGLMAQLSSLLVFDMLTNNSDRFSGGNLMTSPDGRTLYYMDNTFGFQIEPEGNLKCRAYLSRVQKFSRRLVAALRTLDPASYKRALALSPGVLSDEEITAVMARKDWTLRYVDALSAKLGGDKVLVFP